MAVKQFAPSIGHASGTFGGNGTGYVPVHGGILAWLSEELSNFLDLFVEWRQRATDRRVLAAMDDRLLQDIGCSRIDAEREANKPFWRK